MFRGWRRWAVKELSSSFSMWRAGAAAPQEAVELAVMIPRTRTSKEEGTGKPCVNYLIVVSTSASTFEVPRRYKDFDNFDRLLRETYPALAPQIPDLPPKKTFGTMDPHFITNRRITLEQYLQTLLRDNTIANSPLMGNFLAARSFSSYQDAL